MSLTAVIILAVIIFLILISNQERSSISEVNVQYVKHKAMSNYFDDIENIYLPELVKTSAKMALIEMSRATSEDGVTYESLDRALEAVVLGDYTEVPEISDISIEEKYRIYNLIGSTMQTLNPNIEITDLTFKIMMVEQKDPWTIIIWSFLDFKVDTFSETDAAEGSTITYDNFLILEHEISVIGLHAYEDGQITSKWSETPERPGILDMMLTEDMTATSNFEGLCPIGNCPCPTC